MKLDVLDGLDVVKLGVGYKYEGETLSVMPAGADAVAKCEPIYEEFPGWKESTFGCTDWDKLPRVRSPLSDASCGGRWCADRTRFDRSGPRTDDFAHGSVRELK